VGCIIVGSGREIRSTGYNGLPRGILNSERRHSRDENEKYYWFEHAERNAIFNAARSGTSLIDCRMYVNLFPCADCTRAIIQSGINQLNTFMPQESEVFFKRSFEVSKEMFSEANVDLKFFEATA
jgi:dCMP deaminase